MLPYFIKNIEVIAVFTAPYLRTTMSLRLFFNDLVLQLREKIEIWNSQLIQSHEDKKAHKTICPAIHKAIHKATFPPYSFSLWFSHRKKLSSFFSTDIRLCKTWKTLYLPPFYWLGVLLSRIVGWTILNCWSYLAWILLAAWKCIYDLSAVAQKHFLTSQTQNTYFVLRTSNS